MIPIGMTQLSVIFLYLGLCITVLQRRAQKRFAVRDTLAVIAAPVC